MKKNFFLGFHCVYVSYFYRHFLDIINFIFSFFLLRIFCVYLPRWVLQIFFYYLGVKVLNGIFKCFSVLILLYDVNLGHDEDGNKCCLFLSPSTCIFFAPKRLWIIFGISILGILL